MRKKALAVAIAGIMVAPMAAQAVEVELSGHVNRAISFVDTGPGSDVQHVDGGPSQSRWRLTGSQDMGNGMKAGVNWEMGFDSNASGGHTVKGTADGAASHNERHQEVWFSGAFGKISMGQGSEAGDGTTERDVNGTNILNYAAHGSWGGSLTFRGAAGAVTGVTVGATHTNMDPGRIDRLRYDTPVLGPGITLGISTANDNHWSVEASIRTSFAGGKLDGAVHYMTDSGGTALSASDFDQWGGSLSFGFSQGTGITLSYTDRDLDGAGTLDPDNFYAKIGHKFGMHTVHLGYGSTDDACGTGSVATDCDGETWSVGWNYSIPKPKVQFYAVYMNYDFDDNIVGATYSDIDQFIVGSRVRF